MTLRPAREQDRRAIYQWLAESDLTPSMLGLPDFPDAPVPTWDQFCEDYGPHFFDGTKQEVGRSFIIEVGGAAVGHVNYDRMDLAQGFAELDIWLRSKEICGRGYGSDALVALTRYLHAIQQMISELDRLDDQHRWFKTTSVALHDTTPKDFYWQLVRLLASARQPVKLLDRVCVSQRSMTIHRGARSNFCPGLQFIVKSLVDAGAHLEWGREGPWLIGANFTPVSSTEFNVRFGYLLSETGQHEVSLQMGQNLFESAIRITNDEGEIGMFAILEHEYLSVYYHRSRNH